MGLIGIKIKDIKEFLKVNGSIAMPMVSQQANGNFIANGSYVSVGSFDQYQDQVKEYEDFIKFLETKYDAEIPKMFKAALTKVIALQNDGLTSKRLHFKNFSRSQYEAQTSEEYFRTLNYISDAAIGRRLLRPAKAMHEITSKNDRSMKRDDKAMFVLPVIGKDGVVVKRRGDVRGQLQARTVSISEEEALEIRNAMIDEAQKANVGNAQNVVDDIFELSMKAGEFDKNNIVNEESMQVRRDLVVRCIDLVGVDLSQYEVSEADEPSSDNDNSNQTPDLSKLDTIIFDVDKIEMLMKNGKLVIKILDNANEVESEEKSK